MNFTDIRKAVESVSNEKGISEDIVFEAIESALATATKRRVKENAEFRVSIDWEENTCDTFRVWTVVDPATMDQLPVEQRPSHSNYRSAYRSEPEENIFNADAHLTLAQAHEKDPSLQLGDSWEEPWQTVDFGRIMAQIARQVIVQKVREAERDRVALEYSSKIGQIVSGTVKRIGRESVIVGLGGNVEAILLRDHLIPRQDHFRVDDRVKAYLLEIDPENKGPQLILSRTCREMLIELFKMEVPEILEEVIEIRAAARVPGQRAKIAVTTNDGRIDAVGACVGMRGSRVQAVSSELRGERVDVVLWDPDPAQLVINAMSPAVIEQIIKDEDLHSMDILVRQESHATAIGTNGENVRLASELSGWRLNILRFDDAMKEQEEKQRRLIEMFMDRLQVDEDLALVLVEENFTTIEEVAFVDLQEMLEIEGFDAELVEILRSRAQQVLEEDGEQGQVEDTQSDAPAQDLLDLEGMTNVLAYRLAAQGVRTMADLADLSTADVLDMDLDIDASLAGELIMTARKPLFEASVKD